MPTTNAAGQIQCPKCGAPCVPMRGKAEGKGWNCSKQVWNRATKRAEGCSGVVWAKKFERREAIPRPATYPAIRNRTDEQKVIRQLFGTAPAKREIRSRLIIVDAGPGTGKSTTTADSCEALAGRVGELFCWHLCAFNVNAKESLLAKIPQEFANIATINGFGGRIQGYQFRQYKIAKVRNIFRDQVYGIPAEERPRFGPLGAFVERARDSLLYYRDSSGDWQAAIDALCSRYPSLRDKLSRSVKTEETVRDYFPLLMTMAHLHKQEIDLSEQYSRPALDAIHATGWKMPLHLAESRQSPWGEEDIEHLAKLIRSVRLPQQAGVIVDEAQDLSLSQIVLFLACTWRTGELVLVGDDATGTKGQEGYKAGQAIFGWRGAFNGSLTLVARLWKALTGEDAIRKPLSITFRLPPEIVDAIHDLNTTLRSALPRGKGQVIQEGQEQAFTRWLALPAGKRALWLTRRNAPLAHVFMQTVKARKRVCLRGGTDLSAQFDSLMYEIAGFYDDDGEYRVNLAAAIGGLRDAISGEAEEESGSPQSVDDFAAFVLEVAEEIVSEPDILAEADLSTDATVGNLRRFLLFFASRDAERVCSTVYRAKGDEADWVIVDDCEALNAAWNGDEAESEAVRLVACSRAKEIMVLTGEVSGVCVP